MHYPIYHQCTEENKLVWEIFLHWENKECHAFSNNHPNPCLSPLCSYIFLMSLLVSKIHIQIKNLWNNELFSRR